MRSFASNSQASLFHPLALGDVHDGAQDPSAVAGVDRVQGDLDRELAPVFPACTEVSAFSHRPGLRIGVKAFAILHVLAARVAEAPEIRLAGQSFLHGYSQIVSPSRSWPE